MNIAKARQLSVGSVVQYPADRGDPAGVGRVSSITPDAPAQKSVQGQEYIWVEVNDKGKKAVWPSNRLG